MIVRFKMKKSLLGLPKPGDATLVRVSGQLRLKQGRRSLIIDDERADVFLVSGPCVVEAVKLEFKDQYEITISQPALA